MASTLYTSPSTLLPKTLTLTLTPHLPKSPLLLPLRPLQRAPTPLHLPPRSTPISPIPSDAIYLEEIVEKDWSFLDPTSPEGEWAPKARRVISAASIREGSRVLLSFPCARLVERLVEVLEEGTGYITCDLVLAVHESLLALAAIKESHDEVRCWQGPLAELPEKFSSFDSLVFCGFPVMGVPLDALLRDSAPRLSKGARVVISFDQGKQSVALHRKERPDMVTADLPTRDLLDKAATDHFFKIIDFVDEPSFYLAVLEFCGSS